MCLILRDFYGISNFHNIVVLSDLKVLKPPELCLEVLDHSEIWQTSQQHCCQGAYQISKWCYDIISKCDGIKRWWLLMMRHLNSLRPSDAIWRHIWVNIGSGNDLLPDGTKPLPEPMLTYHQWSFVVFTLQQFYRQRMRYQFMVWVWKL